MRLWTFFYWKNQFLAEGESLLAAADLQQRVELFQFCTPELSWAQIHTGHLNEAGQKSREITPKRGGRKEEKREEHIYIALELEMGTDSTVCLVSI